MPELITVSMEGGIADRNEIPAYLGSSTIYGLSRSMLIATNFVSEGRIRKKDYDFNKFSLNLRPAREGSFVLDFVVTYPIAASIAGAIAGGVAGNLVTDLLKFGYNALIGKEDEPSEQIEAALESGKSSPERFLEALEPSVRAAHTIINHGVMNINIGQIEDINKIELNSRTKDFVWTSIINREIKTKLFSISRFDPNSRIGNVFDLEERRPISFQLEKDSDEQTVETIIWSQSQYTRHRLLNAVQDSYIALKYNTLEAQDGRAKKLFVSKARREIRQL